MRPSFDIHFRKSESFSMLSWIFTHTRTNDKNESKFLYGSSKKYDFFVQLICQHIPHPLSRQNLLVDRFEMFCTVPAKRLQNCCCERISLGCYVFGRRAFRGFQAPLRGAVQYFTSLKTPFPLSLMNSNCLIKGRKGGDGGGGSPPRSLFGLWSQDRKQRPWFWR